MTKIKKSIPHPHISEVRIVEERNIFPISWLHKQDYCEYQIFLENMSGIEVAPTKAMIEGKLEHDRLENEFLEEAEPATFEEMIRESYEGYVISREFYVQNIQYGIHGKIDEIHLNPDGFIVIDDKPGTKTYRSNINQVYGYCLAFKKMMIKRQDPRPITAALRERGTDNIYWRAPFDETAENEIIEVINHVHGLISGSEQFISSGNPNKCKACRFKNNCDRFMEPSNFWDSI